MKKTILTFMVLTLLFALVACGGTSSTTSNSTGGTGSTADNSTALSLEMQLLLGTIKLEDTDLAVSADQASQLLPLWQALQSLETSDTAASEEIDAVVNQIEATMTSQQMDAITAMKLTQQDVMTVMSNAGISANDSGASSSTGSSQSGFPAGGFDPGAAGGPPDSGGGPGVVVVQGGGDAGGVVVQGGDPGFDPQQMATAQAGGQSGGSNNQIPAPLLRSLIDLLQKKIQS